VGAPARSNELTDVDIYGLVYLSTSWSPSAWRDCYYCKGKGTGI